MFFHLAEGMKSLDKSVFHGLKREFSEETGHELPNLTNVVKFVYQNNTAIYAANTNEYIHTNLGPKSYGEIIAMHLSHINNIKLSIEGHKQFEFRNCAKRSTMLVLGYFGY
jgi:hypothetical protein